ncbi:MAG: hypothetical protein ABJF10_12905 [Chthoniobacter sp.]|uniref:hypothetical protein n=1 Tax=Chthoniobacter sp. TaxID=2510640 RepID=UPI0032A4F92D
MTALSSVIRAQLLWPLAFLFFAGCSTIATFDPVAYDKATGAKAEALALVDHATESYATRAKDAEAVLLTVNKACEYDRGRSLNNITVKQWEILLDPNGHLFGGFVERWKAKGSLRSAYIAEKRPDIAEAFDQIIGLEIGKRRTGSN